MDTTINDRYYHKVSNAVHTNTLEQYFNEQYHILTDDREEKKYLLWIDYLLDRYNMYKSNGFNKYECEVNCVMDGLESLIKQRKDGGK